MKTVVDTSVVVALLSEDEEYNERASDLLGVAYRDGALVVDDVAFAELCANPSFETVAELRRFLEETGIDRRSPSESALHRAGEQFRTYLERRTEKLQCPSCGERSSYACPSCGSEITARQHIASDFVIGAHAEVDADALLTFDDGFHRDYFDVDVRPFEQ